MENKKNDKILFLPREYFYRALSIFFALTGSICFFLFLYKFDSVIRILSKGIAIFQPIILGFVIAYLMNPTVNFIAKYTRKFSKKIFKKEIGAEKFARYFSVLSGILIFILVILLLLNLVVPSLIDSISKIVADAPEDIDSVMSWINVKLNSDENLKQFVDMALEYGKKWILDDFSNIANTWASYLASGVFGVINFMLDFIIGIMVAIYILLGKRHFVAQSKKIVFALFKKNETAEILSAVRKLDITFGGFISGKIIDSLIIGVLCFIGVTVLRIPYGLLVSVIVGVTNVIPVFGPYIGAIPSTLLILITSPIKALYFVVFIIVLQSFDGNILGPKILGDSTGLSAFWVIVAIMLFGGLFGVVGMIIGVPVFAVIYYGISYLINRKLKKKNLSTDTELYRELQPEDIDD